MGGRVVLLRPVCDADAAGIDFIDWPRLRLRRAFFGRFMCLATPSVVLGESSIDIAARTACSAHGVLCQRNQTEIVMTSILCV